jgi:hypothetical protein
MLRAALRDADHRHAGSIPASTLRSLLTFVAAGSAGSRRGQANSSGDSEVQQQQYGRRGQANSSGDFEVQQQQYGRRGQANSSGDSEVQQQQYSRRGQANSSGDFEVQQQQYGVGDGGGVVVPEDVRPLLARLSPLELSPLELHLVSAAIEDLARCFHKTRV